MAYSEAFVSCYAIAFVSEILSSCMLHCCSLLNLLLPLLCTTKQVLNQREKSIYPLTDPNVAMQLAS